MITHAQISALDAAAHVWERTPFCEGSPVKGAGVSCHHACAEIYFEAQLMPRIPIPNGPSNWRTSPQSLIVDWVEQSGLFVQVDEANAPGDLLGFRLGQAIHHAAIMLLGGRVVHSIVGQGVVIAPMLPAAWERRLERVWRLKALA